MENKDYRCDNGAFHDYECCETCWNKHPENNKGEMFVGTTRYWEIQKEMWIQEAINFGFTAQQSEFLYKKLSPLQV